MKNLTFGDWLYLIAAVFCAVPAIHSGNMLLAGCTLLLLGLFIIVPLARKKSNERFLRSIQKLTEAQCRHYDTREQELQARLTAGELKCLVQWWEEDEFFLDENEHLLFLFTDGEEMDFVVHPTTAGKVKPLLAGLGIEWEKRIILHSDSRILYPPPYAGQKYYNEDGSQHEDLQKLV